MRSTIPPFSDIFREFSTILACADSISIFLLDNFDASAHHHRSHPNSAKADASEDTDNTQGDLCSGRFLNRWPGCHVLVPTFR
ncbi:Hypothetical protein NTJ_00955 [Nesidiocoris tenuis]|uniref:Uncharacterized protein n=1 Tax=Nesidiocoris tenuis TaxID=355587 RepID=A0ABN7A7C7_9HEMI|nr:Hypothetical protein NTJ_00955 [Nesidiocoris tenuis]